MPIPANPVDGEVHAFANGKEITFTALPLASKGTQVSHSSLLTTAGVSTDTNWQYISSQMQFNPDGTKFYMGASDASNLSIGTWDLSTPYDLSTQTFNSMSPSRNIVYMDSAEGMLFTPDGSKLLQFVNLNNSNPSGSRCRCYVFDLTTPFDLSTISNSPSDVDLGTVAGLYGSVHGAAWNGDGTKIFLAAHTSQLREVSLEVAYDMTSAFNSSTVVNHNSVTLNADITAAWGVGFSTNGSIGYIMESNGQTNELHIFDLSTPYSFSTATLNSSVNIDEGTEFNTSYPKKFTMAGDTPLLRASVPSLGEQFIYVNMGSGDVGKWHVTKAAYTGETGSVVTYALVDDLPESPYPTGQLAYVTETKKMYFAGSDEWFVINDSEAPDVPTFVPASPSGVLFSTTNTAHTWTVPAGVDNISIVAIGGGGGGGGGAGGLTRGGGGGGGGLTYVNNISVTPGETLTVWSGRQGFGGAAPSDPPGAYGDGQNGQDSYVSRDSDSSIIITANGGGGGNGGSPYTGGTGGTAWTNNGAIGYAGSNGGTGQSVDGGGGNSANYTGNGATATSGVSGTGVSPFGGDIALTSGGSFQNGGAYGGGGHGASGFGTSGGAGIVRIIWGSGRAFPSTNVSAADSTDAETGI